MRHKHEITTSERYKRMLKKARIKSCDRQITKGVKAGNIMGNLLNIRPARAWDTPKAVPTIPYLATVDHTVPPSTEP